MSTLPDAPGLQPLAVPLAAVTFPLEHNEPDPRMDAAYDLGGPWMLDMHGRYLVNGVAPRNAGNQPENAYVALAQFTQPTGLLHLGGVYWRYGQGAGTLFAGVAGTGETQLDKAVGSANVIQAGALEELPVLSPSREDRASYPDALDPAAALPARQPDYQGPMVSGRLPEGVQVQFLGQARQETFKTTDKTRVTQLRNRVLRPLDAGNLEDGLRVNVWLSAPGVAEAVEVLRDDRPGELLHWL